MIPPTGPCPRVPSTSAEQRLPVKLLWNVSGFNPNGPDDSRMGPEQLRVSRVIQAFIDCLSKWPRSKEDPLPSRRLKVDILDLCLLMSQYLGDGRVGWNVPAADGTRWIKAVWRKVDNTHTAPGDRPCCWEEKELVEAEVNRIQEGVLTPEQLINQRLLEKYADKKRSKTMAKKLMRTGATMTAPASAMAVGGFLLPTLWASSCITFMVAGTFFAGGVIHYFRSEYIREGMALKANDLYERVLEGQRTTDFFLIGGLQLELTFKERLKLVGDWCERQVDEELEHPYQMWLACRDNFQRFLNLQSRMDAGKSNWAALVRYEAEHLYWGNRTHLSQLFPRRA